MGYSTHLYQTGSRSSLIFMGCFFCPMSIAVVVARFYARRLSGAGRGVDDWLALVALIFVLALNGIFIAGTVQGAITGSSPLDHGTPISTDILHLAQKYMYAFQATEKITLGLIKLSILFLWKRLFKPSKCFVGFCWLMIGIMSAWSISFFFATIFQCGTQWTTNWAPLTVFLARCVNTFSMLTVFTTTDLATDFIIMFMPVPLIWKLHMPTKKKVGITSIFMIGLFTISCGIERTYSYLVTFYDMKDNPDFVADFTVFILWSEIEANVAMVVCCMPTLAPVVGKLHEILAFLIGPKYTGQWSPLSSGRGSNKPTNVDVELPVASRPTTLSTARLSYNGILPWQESPTVITEAGYDNTEEKFQQKRGILARTEIYSTFEPMPQEDNIGR